MKKSIIIVVFTICILLSSFNIYSYGYNSNEKIYKNVYIGNVDVGGLTKDEASQRLAEYNENKQINLTYDNKVFTLNSKDISYNYEIKKNIEQAYNIGRDNGYIANIKKVWDLNRKSKEVINITSKYDSNKLKNYIENINKSLSKEPINAKISTRDGDINITPHMDGAKVNFDKLEKIIVDNLNSRNYEDVIIPVDVINPNINSNYLSQINTVLGRYETKFNDKVEGRSYNIKLGTYKVNGILLNPGEEFSFNKLTGKRGVKQGFKEAPVIINGELEDGIAGGICQVSSTLYNSVLYSGLQITQVRNHSIPSSYVSKGRDATLVYGIIDLKFKNNYSHPVYIENIVNKNKVISNIYGNIKDKVNIKIDTEVVKTIPNKVIFETDKTLSKGEEVVKEKGRLGHRINTYRIYRQNEKVIKKELIAENYYPPKNKVILKGE
jgi:vancomycin resistance protein YoaR